MFPEKIHFDDCEVNVIGTLLEHVPHYLWCLALEGEENEGLDTPAKYHYNNVQSVDVVCINSYQYGDSQIYDDAEFAKYVWGVGLKVNLTTNQYFLVYIPFWKDELEYDINYFVEEAYNGIEVVSADTDLSYQLNKMPYSRKSDVIFKSTDGNTLTMPFL